MSKGIQIYDMICHKCKCTNFKYTDESPINPVCQGCGHILSDEHIQKVLRAIYEDHMAQSKMIDCYVVKCYSNSCYCETFEESKEVLKQGIVDKDGTRDMYLQAIELTEEMLPCKIGDFEIHAAQVSEEELAEITMQEFDGF